MANTHCKNCMFSKTADSTQPCEFDIIDIIKDSKELSVVDNYFYIKNYKCHYGFSEKVYESNPELQKIGDLKSFIVEKTKLVYYLVIDIRRLSELEIHNKISIIKNLDIKPKFVSFIASSQNQNIKNIIDLVNENLNNHSIDWKVHSFINSISFNDCINIAAETTVQPINGLQFLVFDAGEANELINNVINHIHYTWIITQSGNYCFVNEKNNINLLSIHIALYKAVISTNHKDIIEVLNNIPNLDIGEYDFEKSK